VERFTNNGESTLGSGIDNAVTSLTVASASSFPTAGNFRIRIDDEIMLVTGVSGTTFTVTRASEGTAAASHSSGATVRHVLTAGAIAAALEWATVTKGSDESRNTTTTLAVDGELVTPALTSGKVYEFEALIIYASPVGGGTPDIKITFGEDTTPRGDWHYLGETTTGAVAHGGTLTENDNAAAFGTKTNKWCVKVTGFHISNGGAFGLYWAQNTSNGNDTTVYAGSRLRYKQVD